MCAVDIAAEPTERPNPKEIRAARARVYAERETRRLQDEILPHAALIADSGTPDQALRYLQAVTAAWRAAWEPVKQ